MSSEGPFDAYHKWLGIAPKDQPPDHYRLLGIERFESDRDVIADAAMQRMGHVRSYQLGKRAELSQRLLNELAAARVCLLDPAKKAAYDAALRAQAAQASAAAKPALSMPRWAIVAGVLAASAALGGVGYLLHTPSAPAGPPEPPATVAAAATSSARPAPPPAPAAETSAPAKTVEATPPVAAAPAEASPAATAKPTPPQSTPPAPAAAPTMAPSAPPVAPSAAPSPASPPTALAVERKPEARPSAAVPAESPAEDQDPSAEPAADKASSSGSLALVEGRFGKAINPKNTPLQAKLKLAAPFTVELWAKASVRRHFQTFLSYSSTKVEDRDSYAFFNLSTETHKGFYFVRATGNSPSKIVSSVDIVDNQWHYLAMTVGADGATLFVDGVPAAKGRPARNANTVAGPEVVSFGFYDQLASPLDGPLDEVRISSGVRRIASVPTAPFTADATTLGLWHFDEFTPGQGFPDASRHEVWAVPYTGKAQTPKHHGHR